MKRIIEEVLQAEEKVEKSLRDAQKKASDIRLDAEKDVAQQIADARQQARDIINSALEDAKTQAGFQREQKLKDAQQTKEDIINKNAAKIDQLVEDIASFILNVDLEREIP